MFSLIPPQYAVLARILLYGALILSLIAFGWVRGSHNEAKKHIAYIQKQAAEATRIAQARTVVTERVLTKYLTKTVPQTQVVTETIEKEVVRYVDAKLDTCPLSAGAVELHDAAAAKRVPNPAKSLDGAASGLAASALTEACTANYATAHKNADKLRGLQEWISEQGKVR